MNTPQRATRELSRTQTVLAFGALVGLIVVGRLVPHPPNFTPLLATSLFAGFLFRRWWLALAVPVTAMLLSDWLIEFYDWRVMVVVYACLLVPVLLRSVIRSRFTAASVGLSTAGCSVLFFLATNGAEWLFGTMYAHSAAGLAACYTAAIPFFQWMLAGDLFYATLLFGGYAWLTLGAGGWQRSVRSGETAESL